MTEADIKTPLVYVMGRDIKPEQAQHVFSITPCCFAVVTNHEDKQLANRYVHVLFKSDDVSAVRELATHLARTNTRPVLTIGDGAGMTVVYSDGEEEELCLSNLTSMN